MSSIIQRTCLLAAGLLVTFHAFGAHVLAASNTVPEIDGSSISAGLGLVTGAILLLRSRKRSR